MAEADLGSSNIDKHLQLLAAGDVAARDELMACASERLLRLTRRLKRDFPAVGRWEQTEDVFQNAVLRLCHSFQAVEIQNSLHFYRLAALHIRRELLDLCRHYQGEHGVGAHHATWLREAGAFTAPETPDRSESTGDPHNLAEWADFHRVVEDLPAEDREVFDLLWYAGLTQAEAAATLKTSLKTVQRRWRGARLRLSAALDGSRLT
ncbi:sigma-70 family RNA polymerase sigma factor [Planctomicrobium piriforme]|uniref:RNA polymerase sigma-70 factor, ECF subfamily n=1 Tax=Planctomicrobium piriforme TaxID=1576369 RepID=A0A1I3C9I2_9PLAN|nr:sigma-70 family RNA polymerase sigma factor [Planctomicrobium piriforme]SFH71137.1 RNA polymerase sigma-70 factor, ECF subfamily [Planctomicrobium piriforme]